MYTLSATCFRLFGLVPLSGLTPYSLFYWLTPLSRHDSLCYWFTPMYGKDSHPGFTFLNKTKAILKMLDVQSSAMTASWVLHCHVGSSCQEVSDTLDIIWSWSSLVYVKNSVFGFKWSGKSSLIKKIRLVKVFHCSGQLEWLELSCLSLLGPDPPLFSQCIIWEKWLYILESFNLVWYTIASHFGSYQ